MKNRIFCFIFKNVGRECRRRSKVTQLKSLTQIIYILVPQWLLYVAQIRGNRFSAAILKMAANALQVEIWDGPIFIYFCIYVFYVCCTIWTFEVLVTSIQRSIVYDHCCSLGYQGLSLSVMALAKAGSALPRRQNHNASVFNRADI